VSNNRVVSDKSQRTENTAAHSAQQHVVTMTSMFAMEARQNLQLWKHAADNRRFALEAASKAGSKTDSGPEKQQSYVGAETGNFTPYMTMSGAGVPAHYGSLPEGRVLQAPPKQPSNAGQARGAFVPPPGYGSNEQEIHAPVRS
jgi:hypothetical protein